MSFNLYYKLYNNAAVCEKNNSLHKHETPLLSVAVFNKLLLKYRVFCDTRPN